MPLSSLVQTGRALSDAIKGKGPTPPPKAPAPPVYRFRIVETDETLVKASDFDGRKPWVNFRLPPSAMTFDQPMRGEVIQDLDGGSTIIDGGVGVAKVSIRGTYGIGNDGGADFTSNAPGFANMREVRDFFLTWAEVNRVRALGGKRPFRLQFRIIGGAWTEWDYRAMWAFPIGLPTEEKNAANPLAWNWSMSFWAWEVERDKFRPSEPVSMTVVVEAKIPKWLKVLQGLIKKFKQLMTIVRLVKRLATEVKKIRDGIISNIRGLFQGIRSLASSIKTTLQALNPLTLAKEVKAEIRAGLNGIRKDLGGIMRWSTTEGYSASRTPGVRPVNLPLNPGVTLQKAAQVAGLDWVAVANRNKLRYPFVAVTP